MAGKRCRQRFERRKECHDRRDLLSPAFLLAVSLISMELSNGAVKVEKHEMKDSEMKQYDSKKSLK